MNESAEESGPRFVQPFGYLRRRVESWIATRTPRVAGPWTINRRRIYIVPTRWGYGYGLLLLVMLLGAMNYSNSMAFALTFLLAGMGLLAMHHTHGNLVSLRLRGRRVAPVFAGEGARFIVDVDNPSTASRYAIGINWKNVTPLVHADVDAAGEGELSLVLQTSTRGWQSVPRFSVQTEFPVGLFHAWTWVELDLACLVYPKPAPAGLRAPESGSGEGIRTGSSLGQDEFAGLRGYQRGDSPRMIHWKSLPKHRSPMVKQFAEALDKELWLDWNLLPPSLNIEQRLSQLTRWIIDSDAKGAAYGLRMPGFEAAPAVGETHRGECLKALAVFNDKQRIL